MREWQLEFGAEIGRAIVNFDGPIVFCVVSRYHGGAFVVFSGKLNPNLETVALEGTRASVIGGAPAAAVVFAREVERAAAADERIVALDARIDAGRRAPSASACAPSARRCGATCWPSTVASSPIASTRPTASSARLRSVRSTRSSRPAALRGFLIDAVKRGMRRAVPPTEGAADGHDRVAQPTAH